MLGAAGKWTTNVQWATSGHGSIGPVASQERDQAIPPKGLAICVKSAGGSLGIVNGS